MKTKVIQVEGHIPSSAYKDTINDGPLIDRKQKFLEKVADIMLDTPAINEAASKALSIFGDRLLSEYHNSECASRGRIHLYWSVHM